MYGGNELLGGGQLIMKREVNLDLLNANLRGDWKREMKGWISWFKLRLLARCIISESRFAYSRVMIGYVSWSNAERERRCEISKAVNAIIMNKSAISLRVRMPLQSTPKKV
jgi:hypothetical protein